MSVPTAALASPSGPGGCAMHFVDEQLQELYILQLKRILKPHSVETYNVYAWSGVLSSFLLLFCLL